MKTALLEPCLHPRLAAFRVGLEIHPELPRCARVASRLAAARARPRSIAPRCVPLRVRAGIAVDRRAGVVEIGGDRPEYAKAGA